VLTAMQSKHGNGNSESNAMGRRPGSARAIDLQSLKQANACITRAIELFVKKDDTEAVAQAELAWRFLDEFVDKHGDDEA
jgi:hypothetical protein